MGIFFKSDSGFNKMLLLCLFAALTLAATRDVRVTMKSYIAPIRGNIGKSPAKVWCPAWSLGARAVAHTTDSTVASKERPGTSKKDNLYRMYTSRRFSVECNGDKISYVKIREIVTDVGKECMNDGRTVCMTPAPVQVTNKSGAIGNLKNGVLNFSWRARARPPRISEPMFSGVCLRSSRYIWHKVSGKVRCKAGKPYVTDLRLGGSGFPSHRLYVNGKTRLTKRQGPLRNLWLSKSSNKVEVR